MSVTVGDIAIDIRAKMERLQSDMDEAKAKVKSGTTEMQALAGVFAGYMAAIGIGNLGGLINSSIQAAAELKQLSERTGATVEGLSAIKSVAKMSGTDIESVASAMNKLTKNLGSADEESKGAAEAIKALGINFDAFKKQSPDQQMLTVGTAMAKFKDNSGLADAAMRLFGKTGASMIPLLKDLAEKGNLNGKITREQAEAADAFEKQMVKMKAAMDGTLRSAILPMLSYLGTLGPLLKAGAEIAAAYFAVFIAAPAILMAAKAAFDLLALSIVEGATAASILNASILTLGPTFAAMTAEMGVFRVAMLSTFGVLAAAFAGWEIGKWLSDNFLEARLAGIALVDGLMTGWEHVKYGAEVAWLGIKAAAGSVLEWVGSAMATLLDKMAGGLSFVGLDKAASTVTGYANALRETTASATDFTAEHEALKAGLEQAVAGVHAITGEMADDAIAQFNAAKATRDNSNSKEDLTDKLGKAGKAAKEMRDKVAEVIGKLQDEILMLHMTAEAAEIYKKQKEAGVAANTKAGQEIANLVKQFRAEKEVIDAAKAAMDAATKGMEAYDAANVRDVVTISDAIKAEELRIATLGMARGAVEEYKLAKLEDALQDARRAQDDPEIKRLQNLIEWQKKLTDTIKRGDIADANKKAADDTAKWWKKTSEDIEKSLTDGLARGWENGKGLWESFRDYIGNAAKSWIIRIAVQPVMGVINSIAGSVLGLGAGDATAAAPSVLGTLGKLGSGGEGILSTIFGGLGAFGTGTSYGIQSLFANGFGATMGAGMQMLGAGSTAAGLGTMAGAALPWIGGALALKSLTDYKITPNGGALIANVSGSGASAVANRSDFIQQGGLFGGGTTHNSSWADADKGTFDYINQSVKTVSDANRAYAEVLGLGGKALDDYKAQLEINTSGMDAAAAKAAIDAAVTKFAADQVSAAYGDAIKQFAMDGETAVDTIKRLASIQVMSAQLNEFGGVFSRIAASSIEARQSLISMAGGIDALMKKSSAFVNDYYSGDEKSGMSAKSILDQLKAVGFDNANTLKEKDDLRRLIETVDVSTEQGRKQLNTLLDVAPQFAQIADVIKTQGGDLGTLALLAPHIASLDTLFSNTNKTNDTDAVVSAQETTNANIQQTTEAVKDSTTAVVSAIDRLKATMDSVVTRLDGIENNGRLANAGGPAGWGG